MIEPPQIVETTEKLTAALHLTVPRSEIRTAMGPGVSEMFAAVVAQGVEPIGPWFTHHLKRPDETFDFEICVEVARPIEPAGRVQPSTWPAMKVARTIYHGDYEGLPGAWGEFMSWIEGQALTTAADLWEVYVVNPHDTPSAADWRTQLNRPLVD